MFGNMAGCLVTTLLSKEIQKNRLRLTWLDCDFFSNRATGISADDLVLTCRQLLKGEVFRGLLVPILALRCKTHLAFHGHTHHGHPPESPGTPGTPGTCSVPGSRVTLRLQR